MGLVLGTFAGVSAIYLASTSYNAGEARFRIVQHDRGVKRKRHVLKVGASSRRVELWSSSDRPPLNIDQLCGPPRSGGVQVPCVDDSDCYYCGSAPGTSASCSARGICNSHGSSGIGESINTPQYQFNLAKCNPKYGCVETLALSENKKVPEFRPLHTHPTIQPRGGYTYNPIVFGPKWSTIAESFDVHSEPESAALICHPEHSQFLRLPNNQMGCISREGIQYNGQSTLLQSSKAARQFYHEMQRV
jgi:hypothetical protein